MRITSFRQKSLVIVLVVVVALIAQTQAANQTECHLTEDILLGHRDHKKIDKVFNCLNGTTMTGGQFDQLLDEFSNQEDHEHHEEDHSHHHEHQFDYKCVKTKLNELKAMSAVYPTMNRNEFASLLDLAVEKVKPCQTHAETPSSAKYIVVNENWAFAFLSAVIISVIGVLCILVVPSLSTTYFNPLFQFLVALAVGTLCGDSLLHLIPHAFSEHSHDGGHDHDSHGGHDDDHTSGIYKGLSALVGIYLFFIIEKTMQIRRARKEKRHRESELNAENERLSLSQQYGIKKVGLGQNINSVSTSMTNATNNNKIGEELSPEERSVLFSKSEVPPTGGEMGDLDAIVSTSDQSPYIIHANKDLKYISQYLPNNKCDENVDHHDHENEKEHLHKHRKVKKHTSVPSNLVDSKLVNNNNNTQANMLEEAPLIASPCICTSVPNLFPNGQTACNKEDCEAKRQASSNKAKLHLSIGSDSENHDDEEEMKLKNSSTVSTASPRPLFQNSSSPEQKAKKSHHGHSHGHHHHGHSHGHSHSSFHIYKSSREKAHHDHHRKHEKEISDVKLIAWMVLMGDGLHNFADGLAIGASFASSLTTGFGTAIAVLCHELPHEIGDFAVVRRAGVSLKRALVFNVVSSVLCIFGVLVGLLIGGIQFLTNWSFLFIAGTFLYISLVDMIPELSENKEDVSLFNFFIQSLGILAGIGIMLIIALMEDSITHLFN